MSEPVIVAKVVNKLGVKTLQWTHAGENLLDGTCLVAAQAIAGWRPIATAPRDGQNILIRFGQDGTSQAKYIPGLPHPWLFIDSQDGITWMQNYAVDGLGGPSHWMPMP